MRLWYNKFLCMFNCGNTNYAMQAIEILHFQLGTTHTHIYIYIYTYICIQQSLSLSLYTYVCIMNYNQPLESSKSLSHPMTRFLKNSGATAVQRCRLFGSPGALGRSHVKQGM